ncbi:hypothetical protein ANN_17508 [Periplaneta americana]|uniref:Uncharacterized protein n=1 Tax=Periplaneta americana TaxID=6978 RepID=A0ABQ8ST50_PERAM|nr:hypothetical protein ANN_17508 [Periplaneta americana]
MSPGSSTDSYPAFAHIGLRENPGKKSSTSDSAIPRAVNVRHGPSSSNFLSDDATLNGFIALGRVRSRSLLFHGEYITVEQRCQFLLPVIVASPVAPWQAMKLSALCARKSVVICSVFCLLRSTSELTIRKAQAKCFNFPKTSLNLTNDTKKAPLMRQLGQEIME